MFQTPVPLYDVNPNPEPPDIQLYNIMRNLSMQMNKGDVVVPKVIHNITILLIILFISSYLF